MQYVVMQNQKNMTISPLKNVFLTPVENQCYSMYKIIKKYYPCRKFELYEVENQNRRDSSFDLDQCIFFNQYNKIPRDKKSQ